MFTNLDFLFVTFMLLVAAGLLALCLMFLVRSPRLKKICFYIIVALGIYVSYIGIRIGNFGFPIQMAVGAVAGIASAGSLVLERMAKGDEKKFRAACILAAAALIIGMVNAFS